jgi:hypothetical protein
MCILSARSEAIERNSSRYVNYCHFANLPHLFLAGDPLPPDTGVLPPCGWSIGFIFTPLTLGNLPIQELAPAFPNTRLKCDGLDTVPIVANKVLGNSLISLDGNLNNVDSGYCFNIVANVPAALL